MLVLGALNQNLAASKLRGELFCPFESFSSLFIMTQSETRVSNLEHQGSVLCGRLSAPHAWSVSVLSNELCG